MPRRAVSGRDFRLAPGSSLKKNPDFDYPVFIFREIANLTDFQDVLLPKFERKKVKLCDSCLGKIASLE